MKRVCIILLSLLLSYPVYSQLNPRIGPRIFNYSVAYGPRKSNVFYSIGYSFSSNNSIPSIEFGYFPISAGMYIVQNERFVLNSKPQDFFYTLNYVYRNKKVSRLLLIGGMGPSINEKFKGMVVKIGADFRITNPMYISLHSFQELYGESKNHFTIGAKLYLF